MPHASSLLPDPGALPVRRRATAGLDFCNPGSVLRAVLFVQAVTGVALLFTAAGFAAWAQSLALASAVSLPATLLWLLASCGLQRRLARLGSAWQRLAAGTIGAAAGAAASALGDASGLAGLVGNVPVPVAALAGAALGAVLFEWLWLRSRARAPADTAARLAELQSRIRPHFLFNTLNTALSLVRIDPQRAEEVLEDLAELFRGALADGGDAVTLADEIDLARRYLAIEQIRFGARLSVVWELDPAAGSARVPPLLLQPLVENAVRHGVEPAAQGGSVRIRTRAQAGRVQVVIDNSLPEQPSAPGHGMALRNVRERLALMHDVAAQFESRREPGRWRVQIGLPL